MHRALHAATGAKLRVHTRRSPCTTVRLKAMLLVL